MKYLLRFMGVVLTFQSTGIIAQPNSFLRNTNEISKEAYDTIVKKQFSKMATGQSYSGNYANFVAFDPVETTLTGNAFLSFGNRINSNIQLKTGLLDDKISGLFLSEGNINTNTSFDFKLNFRLDKQYLRFDMKEYLRVQNEKHTLRLKKQQDSILEFSKLNSLPATIQRCLDEKLSLRDSILRVNTRYQSAFGRLGSCVTVKCRGDLTDTLKILQRLSRSILTDTLKLGLQLDSLRNILFLETIQPNDPRYVALGGPFASYSARYRRSTREKYEKEALKIEKGIRIEALNIAWVSFGVGGSNQSIKTYNTNNSFSDQINSKDLQSWNYSATFNWLRVDSAHRQCLFLSAGLEYKQTNNLTDLDAFVINQTSLSTGNQVTRQIKKDYTVYQDSLIQQYNSLKIFLNYYHFIGSNQNHAIHLSPSATFRDTKKEIYNLQFGYIYSFTNAKTGKGKLNTELYVKLNDISQTVTPENKFSKRLQIGVSFTIPFNININ